jgi:rhodanese-related sulfurtransferase
MREDLRMDADEIKKRMQAGEEFLMMDVRNPNAWAEAGDMAAGAIRVPLHDLDKFLPRLPRSQAIAAYCT